MSDDNLTFQEIYKRLSAPGAYRTPRERDILERYHQHSNVYADLQLAHLNGDQAASDERAVRRELIHASGQALVRAYKTRSAWEKEEQKKHESMHPVDLEFEAEMIQAYRGA